MRQLLVVLVFITSVLTAISQRNPGRCEENPTLIDSVYSNLWNPSTLDWENSTVQIYSYHKTNVTEILTVDANTRNPVRKSESYYDHFGKLHTRINTSWVNGVQMNVHKAVFSYEIAGNIEYVIETYYLWRNGAWVLWGKFIFEFVDGKRMRYLQQLVNTNGELYDYAEYKLYYENNLLKYWDAKRLSDQVILWDRVHYYDLKNRMTERVISRNFYNPVDRTNQLVFSEKTNYFYDQFSLNNEIINERWNGTAWENLEKLIYHRKIDKSHQVRICFNGRNLCIAKPALPALLKNGATLGSCPKPENTSQKISRPMPKSLVSAAAINIFPNPAFSAVSISAPEKYTRVELINSNGQTIRSVSLLNGENTVIERNGLPSGIYFLRFVGQDEVKTEKVIFQ